MNSTENKTDPLHVTFLIKQRPYILTEPACGYRISVSGQHKLFIAFFLWCSSHTKTDHFPFGLSKKSQNPRYCWKSEGIRRKTEDKERKEVVGRRVSAGYWRRIVEVVYLCCVHGSGGHTLRREIGEGQPRAHPLLKQRGGSCRRRGITAEMRRGWDRCVRVSIGHVFPSHSDQLPLSGTQPSRCVFEVWLPAERRDKTALFIHLFIYFLPQSHTHGLRQEVQTEYWELSVKSTGNKWMSFWRL